MYFNLVAKRSQTLQHLTRYSKLDCLRRLFATNSNNSKPNYVVVGGVAGGASTAARLRRNDEHSNIIMFERGKYVSFANCGLPYYVGNVVKDESKLLVANPDMFKKRFDIDVRVESTVMSINRQEKTVEIRDAINETTYEQPYDKLVLAMGAAPIRPAVEGLDLPGVFSVRTIQNSRAIRDYIVRLPRNRNKCVIVGGGFVGLEMCENMIHRGFDCTIVDALSQVMGPIDFEMILPFHNILMQNNVNLIFNEALSGISVDTHDSTKQETVDSIPHLIVHTKSGSALPADIVILGIGVSPESTLAHQSGLLLGMKGSIKTNEHMQTSDPNIFAVGDVVQTKESILDTDINLALAGPAQLQARVVADYITKTGVDYSKQEGERGEEKIRFRGVQCTSVCGIFSEIIAATGLTYKYIERFAPEILPNIVEIFVHPGHHVDFYPNSRKVHLKLIFDKVTRKVLGAQACGQAGIVKAIDTIAAYIQMNASVDDLARAELCYAPAFGSARGPVNIVGQLGMNVCDNLLEIFDFKNDLYSKKKKVEDNNNNNKYIILDVREKWEVEGDPVNPDNRDDHIDSINIPLDELRDRCYELYGLKENGYTFVTLCYTGKRAYVAARFLTQKGLKSQLLSGGIVTYHMHRHETEYTDH